VDSPDLKGLSVGGDLGKRVQYNIGQSNYCPWSGRGSSTKKKNKKTFTTAGPLPGILHALTCDYERFRRPAPVTLEVTDSTLERQGVPQSADCQAPKG